MFNNDPKITLNTRATYSVDSMRMGSTLVKIGTVLSTMTAAAVVGWYLFLQGSSLVTPLLAIGSIGGILLAVISSFKPELAKFTALAYSVCQGVSLGILSAALEIKYPGIAVISVMLTTATASAMLLLYRLKVIQVTETLKSVTMVATAAVGLTYGLVLLSGLFGFNTSSFFESSSITSILFSLFVVGLAAFNLLLDFNRIEEGVEEGHPRFMEWYAAFSVLVTLIWLYVEILRLLMKFARRNAD